MSTTTELKRNMRIEIDGEPYLVVETSTQTPSARGQATLIKAKLRNLKSKQLLAKTFKAGERFKLADFEIRPCRYLYDDGPQACVFMDEENYEQHTLPREDIAYELGFLRPNDEARALFFDGACFGIEIPPTVVLKVTEAESAVRGDTATHATKSAKLETGLEIQVPMFVEVGTDLVIDTREARYVRRA